VIKDQNNALVKWGATSVGQRRYATSLIAGRGWSIKAIAWGARSDMWKIERELTTVYGGPQNFERWANSLPPVLGDPLLSALARDALLKSGVFGP